METALILASVDMMPIIEREINRDPRLQSRNTRRGYLNDLTHFEAWRLGRPLTLGLVEDYATHLAREAGQKRASVNRALSAVRWWAKRLAGLAFEDPAMTPEARQEIIVQTARVRTVEGIRGKNEVAGRHIPMGEVDALMRACANDHTPWGVRDAALIALGVATGARRFELAGLQLADWEATDTEAVITIRGKGAKERKVNVCNGAYAAVRDWLSLRGTQPGALFCAIRRNKTIVVDQGMTTEAMAQLLAKREQQAGIVRHLRWHDLRRTLVGDLLDAGTDIVTVGRIVGHASPETTARYDRRPDEVRRRALGSRHVPYYGRGLV